MYHQSNNCTEMVLTDDDGETYEECTYTYCGDRSKRDLEFAEQFLQHSGIASRSPPPPVPQPLNLNGNSDRAQNALRLFSPDLDFLEMDFDPGIGAEAEEQTSPAMEEVRGGIELVFVSDRDLPSTSTSGKQNVGVASIPEPTCSNQPVSIVETYEELSVDVVDSVDLNSNIVRNCFLEPSSYNRIRRRGSDPVCHRERPKSLVKYASADHPDETLKKPVLSVDIADAVTIWSEDEVEAESTKLAGGAGVVAITLALRAFGWSHVSHQVVCSLRARSRKMAMSVPEYLRVCAAGEFNQKDLALAIADVSDGSLTSSFVELSDDNLSSVSEWLPGLIRSGQIPILTFPAEPDCSGGWTHRFVNRVDSEGLELVPPVSRLSYDELKTLAAESPRVVVPALEVYESWRSDDDVANLRMISQFDDVRWTDWNVLGQICHLFRNGPCSLQNVILPSEFRFGITLVSLIEK